MGIFSDQLQARVGEHLIEVEAHVLGFKSIAHYQLLIDNHVVDKKEAMIGSFTLRGFIDREIPVTVRVNQTWWGTRYRLSVNGEEIPMRKLT